MSAKRPHLFYRLRLPWDATGIERLLAVQNIRYYSLQTLLINYYLDKVPGKHPLSQTEVWMHGMSA